MTALIQTASNGGNDTTSIEVGINTANGTTLVATISAWMTGNIPFTVESIQDSADQTWQITQGGSFSPNTGLFGVAAVATCIGAEPITEVTVNFSLAITGFGEMNVQEFGGLPAGATLLAAAASSVLQAGVTSYTTPALTTPAVALAVAYTSFLGEFTGASPGWTIIGTIDTIGGYDLAAAAGSVSVTFTTGVSNDAPSSAIIAIGARPPAAGAVSPALADAIRPGRLFPSVGRG